VTVRPPRRRGRRSEPGATDPSGPGWLCLGSHRAPIKRRLGGSQPGRMEMTGRGECPRRRPEIDGNDFLRAQRSSGVEGPCCLRGPVRPAGCLGGLRESEAAGFGVHRLGDRGDAPGRRGLNDRAPQPRPASGNRSLYIRPAFRGKIAVGDPAQLAPRLARRKGPSRTAPSKPTRATKERAKPPRHVRAARASRLRKRGQPSSA